VKPRNQVPRPQGAAQGPGSRRSTWQPRDGGGSWSSGEEARAPWSIQLAAGGVPAQASLPPGEGTGVPPVAAAAERDEIRRGRRPRRAVQPGREAGKVGQEHRARLARAPGPSNPGRSEAKQKHPGVRGLDHFSRMSGRASSHRSARCPRSHVSTPGTHRRPFMGKGPGLEILPEDVRRGSRTLVEMGARLERHRHRRHRRRRGQAKKRNMSPVMPLDAFGQQARTARQPRHGWGRG